MGEKCERLKKEFTENLTSSMIDENKHRDYLFLGVSALLALYSLVMSVINIIMKDYQLMVADLSFVVICIANVFLARTKLHKKILDIAFVLVTNVLFAFYIITGSSEGVTVFSIAAFPCFSILIFGRKEGSIYSIITFLMIVFFFWIPVGQSLLQYTYSPSFLLRFPFFYVFLCIAFYFLEWIRVIAQRNLVKSDEKVRYMCGHDALTGLSNRFGFYEEVSKVFKNKMPIKKCSVIMADIDHFKTINDSYGHLVGDAFLKEVSAVIKDALAENTVICRRGGDEFLMLLVYDHDAEAICENICKCIEQRIFKIEGKDIKTTISIGVCSSENPDESIIEKMIRIADDSLYYAKHNGRNTAVVVKLEEAE